jgi:hypothetical protein
MGINELNNTARPAGQLFCLVDLGDGDGIRRPLETDLTPRAPFSIDPGWYQACWYGDRSKPTLWQARNILGRSRAVVRQLAKNVHLSITNKAISLVRRSAAGSKFLDDVKNNVAEYQLPH